MDIKLMKEFEELEGFTDQNFDDEASLDDNDDDDGTMRPPVASNLSNSDVYYELEKRSLKTTGFPDTDREILQRAFDEEFKRDLEKAKAQRREVRKRAARQAGLQRRRMQMEKLLQEEQDELARNHQISMMIELIRDNKMGRSSRLVLNSICARSLAKALWPNNTIICLDLSSNDLNDHSGSYLARILKRNNTIQKMELDNNKLGVQTLVAFGESLKINTSLQYLSLDSNPLAENGNYNGFVQFGEALAVNKTLKSLNLWRVGANSTGGNILARAIEKNQTILFCDVGHNNMDMKDISRIARQLDKNLSAFEAAERKKRAEEATIEEREMKIRQANEEIRREQELSAWLDERRLQRAEARRIAEAERLLEAKLLLEEQKRKAIEDKERERKAAEEAEAKKKKKKGKK